LTAHPRFPISGAQLAVALTAIVIATAAVPPGAAWLLNSRRITQTHTRAVSAAEYLRARTPGAAWADISIACGPGRLPQLVPGTQSARTAASARESHSDWISSATPAPELFGAGMPTDAWGRCFLFNVGTWASGRPLWLLSAGPNGLVETPVDSETLGGDDIGARVR